MEPVDIKLLSSLLYPEAKEDADDDDGGIAQASVKQLTPGDLAISFPEVKTERSNDSRSKEEISGVRPADTDLLGEIWELGEVVAGAEVNVEDPRQQPQYNITFRQRVSSSHVYLPMSVGCEEDMVVSMELPGDRLVDVTLEVTTTTLRLASPTHSLHLSLPRTVDQQRGVATWDPTTHTLVVTVPVSHQPLLTPVNTRSLIAGE